MKMIETALTNVQVLAHDGIIQGNDLGHVVAVEKHQVILKGAMAKPQELASEGTPVKRDRPFERHLRERQLARPGVARRKCDVHELNRPVDCTSREHITCVLGQFQRLDLQERFLVLRKEFLVELGQSEIVLRHNHGKNLSPS
jgi:hypothetical protein